MYNGLIAFDYFSEPVYVCALESRHRSESSSIFEQRLAYFVFCFFVMFIFKKFFSFSHDCVRHVFRFLCLIFFFVSLSGALLIFVIHLNVSVRFLP